MERNAESLVKVTKVVIFLSAFLLFSIQPLVAKFILPHFGGTYTVWTMVVFFFTTMLLFGYVYASLLITWPRVWARGIHTSIIVLAITVIGISWARNGVPVLNESLVGVFASPALSVVGLLLGMIGLSTLVLASTSVVAQRLYSDLTRREPYPLYSLSNLGSLLGLLTYPFLFELWLPVSTQAIAWSLGFLTLSALLLLLLWRVPASVPQVQPVSENQTKGRAVSIVDSPLRFIFLAAVPTFFLATATEYLSKGVASFPLLWVLPLSAYLLSFVAAFYQKRRPLPSGSAVLLIPLFLPVLFLLLNTNLSTGLYWSMVGLITVAVFIVGFYFHSRIYDARPSEQHMGRFYVLLTFGGAVGSGVVGLLLPLVLNRSDELLWFSAALLVWALFQSRSFFQSSLTSRWRIIGFYLLMTVFVSIPFLHGMAKDSVTEERNFYGSLRVYDDVIEVDEVLLPVRYLINGSIIHGFQALENEYKFREVSYYGPRSGIGVAIHSYAREKPPRLLAVGAGIGIVSAYCSELAALDYVEINPAVVAVAERDFSYIESCSYKGEVVIADGRLYLEQLTSVKPYDIIMIDAFTDDAIPLHLLTVDAFEDAYLPHLSDDGMIAVHISNRYLDLAPPIAGAARQVGLTPLIVARRVEDGKGLENSSVWMLLTRNSTDFEVEEAALLYNGKTYIWTDERSSILKALTLKGGW